MTWAWGLHDQSEIAECSSNSITVSIYLQMPQIWWETRRNVRKSLEVSDFSETLQGRINLYQIFKAYFQQKNLMKSLNQLLPGSCSVLQETKKHSKFWWFSHLKIVCISKAIASLPQSLSKWLTTVWCLILMWKSNSTNCLGSTRVRKRCSTIVLAWQEIKKEM